LAQVGLLGWGGEQELFDSTAEQPRYVHLWIAEPLADLGLGELVLVLELHDQAVAIVERFEQRVERQASNGRRISASRVPMVSMSEPPCSSPAAGLVEWVGMQRAVGLTRLEDGLDVHARVLGDLGGGRRRAGSGGELVVELRDTQGELLKLARGRTDRPQSR
jgi:hypothetical protein